MGLEASNDGGVSIDDLYCFLSRKGHIRRIGCGQLSKRNSASKRGVTGVDNRGLSRCLEVNLGYIVNTT